MSRIGKLPISIPDGVQVEMNGQIIKVKGPRGELKRSVSSHIDIEQQGDQLIVTRKDDEKIARAMHGTTRAVIQNMVIGVSDGFQKSLEISGVGYKANMEGANLVVIVGYSHPVLVAPPAGIEFEVAEKDRIIVVKGINKEAVGQVAADIRKIRPPGPYKGEGIRYLGERVRRKAGKSAASGG